MQTRMAYQVVPQTTVQVDGQDARSADLQEGQPVRASYTDSEGRDVAVEIHAGQDASGGSSGALPDSVLNRPKAKFWEGAGVGELLAHYADERISAGDFKRERQLPDGSQGVDDQFIKSIMGRLTWQAASDRDYPILLGVTLVSAVIVRVAHAVKQAVQVAVNPQLAE